MCLSNLLSQQNNWSLLLCRKQGIETSLPLIVMDTLYMIAIIILATNKGVVLASSKI